MHSSRWARGVCGALSCSAIAAICLTGCSVETPTVGAPDPGLRGQWVLQSGSDSYGSINLLNQNISLTITSAAVATGRASCSVYTARIFGSERSLLVTANTPQSFSCTTADQSVLQLEYLSDLGRVDRSSVTADGLELTGPGVELHYTRATAYSLDRLLDRTWQLEFDGAIDLHVPTRFVRQSGAFIQFQSAAVVSGTTRCLSFTGKYQQIAAELVADHLSVDLTPNCDQSDDPAASDLTRLLEGGFTFTLGGGGLILTSTRAGLTLDFSEAAQQ